MGLDFKQYLSFVESEANRFDELLATLAQPDRAVVGCPGWTVADLRDHMAGVFAFWLAQVIEGDSTAEEATFPDQARAKESVSGLASELIEALAEKGQHAPCWNWSGVDLVTGWVARRMANEIAVHGADAAATAGHPVVIPDQLAADGIDELVEVFFDAAPEARRPGAPLLRLVTPARTWNVAVSEDGVWIDDDRANGEADTAVSGSTCDVVLVLWGRPSGAELRGDPSVLTRWQSFMGD